MNIPEWMPVNPCDECGRRISECRYPSDHCEREYIYKGKLAAQKKLMEYLIEYSRHTELMKVPVILKPQLVTMLKQLEEQ